MAAKKIGISRDLLIHPGETIADVLTERNISQAELAAITGVTPAYISNVVAGKKDISANFAFALEYALGVPKSFWLNLQANYEAELLELNEIQTVTEEERIARKSLGEIVKYLREKGKIPAGEGIDDSILSLRKVLQVRNIAKLGELIPAGAFRISSSTAINSYVLGAWLRLCQIRGEARHVLTKFDVCNMESIINETKKIMFNNSNNIQEELQSMMKNYGIDFSIVRNFRGAPVQGYIAEKQDGSIQMIVTIRGAFADIFWFSLFHELGHLANGDFGKKSRFIDIGNDESMEKAADKFASNSLLNPEAYEAFILEAKFDIDSIINFSKSQQVMPFVVIGRLQREKYIGYNQYSNYKIRYKWAD